MVLSDREKLDFKLFCQQIITKPRVIDEQPHKREGIYLWCEDWRMIELCKYFFNGRDMYYEDPPPNRLKNNPLWSKDEIATQAEKLFADFGSVDKIIEYLKQEREKGGAE